MGARFEKVGGVCVSLALSLCQTAHGHVSRSCKIRPRFDGTNWEMLPTEWKLTFWNITDIRRDFTIAYTPAFFLLRSFLPRRKQDHRSFSVWMFIFQEVGNYAIKTLYDCLSQWNRVWRTLSCMASSQAFIVNHAHERPVKLGGLETRQRKRPCNTDIGWNIQPYKTRNDEISVRKALIASNNRIYLFIYLFKCWMKC